MAFGGNSNAFGQSSAGGSGSQNASNSTGGLFGSAHGWSTPAQGLFGHSSGQQNQAGGLFGNTNQQANHDQSGGLFGQRPSQQNNVTGGLFGTSNEQTQQPQTGGLFGGYNHHNRPTMSAFGSTNANAGSPFGGSSTNTGGGLFGNQQSNTNTGGLFGNNNHPSRNTSLFGGHDNRPCTPSPFAYCNPSNHANGTRCDGASRGLFGSGQPHNTSGGGLFGNTAAFTSTCGFQRPASDASSSAIVPLQPSFGFPAPPGYDYAQGAGTTLGYAATQEKEANGATSDYTSVSFFVPYQQFSHEELRLVDYNQGRHVFVAPPFLGFNTLASKDVEIAQLKARIQQLEAGNAGQPQAAIQTPHIWRSSATIQPPKPAQASASDQKPGKDASQTKAQEKRLQDIEASLSKVTALLKKQGLSTNTAKSAPTDVIYTPGSSTDTTPSPENDEGFVNLGEDVTGSKPKKVVKLLIPQPETLKKDKHKAGTHSKFKKGSLLKTPKLSEDAERVLEALQLQHSLGESGTNVQYLSSALHLSYKKVVNATDELVRAVLITTTTDEDTFALNTVLDESDEEDCNGEYGH